MHIVEPFGSERWRRLLGMHGEHILEGARREEPNVHAAQPCAHRLGAGVVARRMA
jgi:hypothetical protein